MKFALTVISKKHTQNEQKIHINNNIEKSKNSRASSKFNNPQSNHSYSPLEKNNLNKDDHLALEVARQLKSLNPCKDCHELSRLFINNTGMGKMISLHVKKGALPVRRGVSDTLWSNHAAVKLTNGKIVDPLLGKTFKNMEIFKYYISGHRRVIVMLNGEML